MRANGVAAAVCGAAALVLYNHLLGGFSWDVGAFIPLVVIVPWSVIWLRASPSGVGRLLLLQWGSTVAVPVVLILFWFSHDLAQWPLLVAVGLVTGSVAFVL